MARQSGGRGKPDAGWPTGTGPCSIHGADADHAPRSTARTQRWAERSAMPLDGPLPGTHVCGPARAPARGRARESDKICWRAAGCVRTSPRRPLGRPLGRPLSPRPAAARLYVPWRSVSVRAWRRDIQYILATRLRPPCRDSCHACLTSRVCRARVVRCDCPVGVRGAARPRRRERTERSHVGADACHICVVVLWDFNHDCMNEVIPTLL